MGTSHVKTVIVLSLLLIWHQKTQSRCVQINQARYYVSATPQAILYVRDYSFLCPDQFVVYANKILHKLHNSDFSSDDLKNQSHPYLYFTNTFIRGKPPSSALSSLKVTMTERYSLTGFGLHSMEKTVQK